MKYSIAILATLFANATLVVPTTADEVTESRIGDLKDKVQRLLEANELSYYDEKKLPKKFEELLNTLASDIEKTGKMDLTNGDVTRSLALISEEMSTNEPAEISPFGFSEEAFIDLLINLLVRIAEMLFEDVGSSKAAKNSKASAVR